MSLSSAHISCFSQRLAGWTQLLDIPKRSMAKSGDDMKWETKMQHISFHIMHPQRGFARTAFRHYYSCLQNAPRACLKKKPHKWVNTQQFLSSLFSLCLCLLSRDNLSLQFLSSSIQPRGAIPQWNKIFLNILFPSPFFKLHYLYPNAII